jgi:dTDP-4-dehydrorhamnose reductase
MKRILLLSPDGMLGRAFDNELRAGAYTFDTLRFPEFDLTKPESLARIAELNPTHVIHCSAYTDVDGAETHEALAMQINGDGVGELARVCRSVGAVLVHFGSDYVFDGEGKSPYPVDAPLAPQAAYARSKARGEVLLRESGAEHLYLRTSWLYAPWAKNFVRTIAKNAKVRPELKVVNDQRGRPTSAEHLAKTTLQLLDKGARGTLHVTDGGECTWFELAREIVSMMGLSETCKVTPCMSRDWPSPVKRPAYSVLDLSATEALVGPMGDWRAHVRDVLSRLEPL